MMYYFLLVFMLFSSNTQCNIQLPQEINRDAYLQEHLFWHKNEHRFPHFISYFYDLIKHGIQDIQDLISVLPNAIASLLLPHNPYKNEIAVVRYTTTDELCIEEKQFLNNRTPFIKKGFSKFLGNNYSDNVKLPRIGFCFSGGGFRAMLMTFGFLKAAEDIGLLDATTYMSGLSGSTWAIGPWIASGKSIQQFTHDLINHIKNGLNHIEDIEELQLLFSNLLSKVFNDQCISAIDIYGAVLVNTLLTDLGKNRLSITLTESHKNVIHGSVPLPIYSSITTNPQPYEWMEVTPFEVGSTFLKAYVPTWSYGRTFKNGSSINNTPEQTLGYYLGIFGSAFELNFQDLLRFTAFNIANIKQHLPPFVDTIVEKIINIILYSPLNSLRLFPSMLFNYTHKEDYSPLHKDQSICLVDAGIDFNLPFPPLLRKQREVDIIIVYDASADIEGAPELQLFQKYAQRKGIALPSIDLTIADKQLVSIFKDEQNPETPIIIYIPRIKNSAFSESFDPEECIKVEYCGTFNFAYTQEQINNLTGLAGFTLKQHAGVIKYAIEEVMERKKLG